jgi:hypothetical protein
MLSLSEKHELSRLVDAREILGITGSGEGCGLLLFVYERVLVGVFATPHRDLLPARDVKRLDAGKLRRSAGKSCVIDTKRGTCRVASSIVAARQKATMLGKNRLALASRVTRAG